MFNPLPEEQEDEIKQLIWNRAHEDSIDSAINLGLDQLHSAIKAKDAGRIKALTEVIHELKTLNPEDKIYED